MNYVVKYSLRLLITNIVSYRGEILTDSESIRCYCLFVRSGSEQTVVDAIMKKSKGITVVAPKRFMQEKRRGEWQGHALALLPGYVFLFGDLSAEEINAIKVDNVYKLLKYDNEFRELIGDDKEYALWIYRNHGEIGTSKVLDLGGEIRVVEGPLIDCVGKIVRLDKHKKRATVQFEFEGRIRTVTLAAEVLTEFEVK